MDKRIAFLGAGSLAEAMLAGIIKAEVVARGNIIVTNKSNEERLAYIENRYRVRCLSDKEAVFTNADIIILASKPKDAEESITSIKPYLNEEQLIISTIAGLSTEKIEKLISMEIPVVRTMPNTSALIGHSATALSAGKYVEPEHLLQTDQLFQTIGMTKLVDEKDMHTITAISGSGPAFIYYFVEAMEKAAMEFGLDGQIAKELIAQTVIGAGNMLQQSGETPAVLRKNITSPGGTTEAGIADLDRHKFEETIISCIQHARDRSVELGRK
ncbi:pyrroline-5-carboxylate reductase [Oceanobacillus sp. FSL K6-2867]|uniref:pyrroline-5-carboxylate reductase n=1 Tax=Oceanobacillus sp. FSL K6-2867 TaxID=2954748 RepID=UPI0030D6CF8D